ncbi:type II DNA topoisomerase [Lepidopterella palustris CBS 459.81]|uniref:DNA topoisomerase 2 n=1 Tax=Lepidopterella palustris CBS 459.81 TaxID=1314670 RepID=A0A8E2E8K9_9PEZI|nr:type II DNA topoisomerase [Lepidopterella palustris CBS 459.81]
MDDSLADSVFDDGASSDFEPVKPVKAVKAVKAKAPPKKAVATTKPRGRPAKGLTQTTLKATKTTAPKKRRKDYSDDENSDIEMVDIASNHDDSLLSNTPPNTNKQKKAPAPKKSGGKPLAPIDNESFGLDGAEDPKSKSKAGGSDADRYQMLTHLEHIMKRPDTYIGSVERTEKQMWVFNSTTEAMEFREVSYVPGLYKIFDEILVNAADNKQNDKNMNEIKVTIDRESGEISVRNNGKGIPIEIHKQHGIYVPEMIFGNLLTSSNYDDDQAKVTGGRNGYGAKLCNVFSTEFTIETADSKNQKKYKQTWTNNMGNMGKPKITAYKGDDYTKVTYTADFKKFKMAGMDDDFEALAKRRVYDLAGTVHIGSGKGPKVKVYLNGDKIKVDSFKKYMEMYTKAIAKEQGKTDGEGADSNARVIITDSSNERWEIGFAVSDGSFNQVSFVNSIATTSGGTHVNYVADQIVEKLMAVVKKKNKGGVALKNNQIRNHIFLFVNCLIVNPAFTSQTKEQLTTKASQFGSKCTVSEKFLKDIEKTEAVNNILHFAQQKADQILKKSDGNRRTRMNNSKLTDANKAGTKDGYKCTLILTEGDSASLLALAGRAVVDPDLFGVFPLRGKLLNVRDASIDQISKNQEIQNIKKFMGLQHKKEYTDTKSLRYGHLMIMTDQDHDGSHIKGLLINFLQVQFPSLLKIEGFLMEFITPIVKTWKGDPKNPKQLKSFFSMPEYEEWKQQPGNQKGWDHKYFKGLGTSSPKDADVYFRALDTHLKQFHTMKDHEADLIELAFSKKKADARKEWLREFVPGNHLDLSTSEISYEDFVNKELILFSMADNLRSIPSVIDGFKPGQRKVLYTCFKRNIRKDIKVVDLAGSVSGSTDYAYGEASMQGTIIGLAQNFVGSNNINCLEPSGNFGSRLQGGQDAASARYIYTRLSPFARRIFHPQDDALLKYGESDGRTIEPEMYVPILPMILVNGADGIGTGWSSSIPNYNPIDIVDNLRIRMKGTCKEDMKPMTPWFRGFTGEVVDLGGDRVKFSGIIRQTGDNEVEVTELPVRFWTQDFKDKLEDIIKAEKVPSFIKDYTEYNTPDKVHFIIKLEDKHMSNALEKGLEDTFKLSKTMATSNLVAFDAQGRIHKYATVLDIMEEFYHIRLRYYQKRKEYQLGEMQKELEKMTNQSRFIQMIIDGKLTVSRKKKSVLVTELQKLNFKRFPKVADARKAGEQEDVVEEEETETEAEAGASDYDYLLGMAIWSLTQERVEKLLKQIGDKELEIDVLSKLSPKDLWAKDLDDFVQEWHDQLDEEAKQNKKIANMGRRGSRKLGIGAGGSKPKKRKADDSDAFSDDDFGPKKSKKAAASRSQPKPGGLLSYLGKHNSPPPKKNATQALKNGAASISAVTKPVGLDAMDIDVVEDITERKEDIKGPAVSSKARAATTKPKKASPVSLVSNDDDYDDDDDVFAAVAKEAKEKPAAAPSRQARAAVKRVPKYAISDDSDDDNGDDLLGDVSSMVKGIGSGTNETTNGRPLFSAAVSARPGSSNRPNSATGLTAKVTARPVAKSLVDISDDETDYTKLMPQASPQRPAPRNTNETMLGSDDDDAFGFGVSKPATKVTARPSAKPTTKPAPKEPAKRVPKPKTVASTIVAKKTTQLSPAAKAYAAKFSKAKDTAKPAPKKAADSDIDDDEELDEINPVKPYKAKGAAKLAPKKKAKDSSDVDGDNDEDVNALANDILSDEDESDVPALRAAARPSRRAAVARPKYQLPSDDESEEDASEASFDDESD